MTWRKRQTIEHMWKVASGNPHHDTNWHDPVVIAFAALVREEVTKERDRMCEHCKWRNDENSTLDETNQSKVLGKS